MMFNNWLQKPVIGFQTNRVLPPWYRVHRCWFKTDEESDMISY